MKKTALVLAIAGLPLMATNAFANGGQIDINGQITDTTCNITIGEDTTGNGTVTLPTVSSKLLAADGDIAGSTKFDIELSGCTGPETTVRAYFEAIAGENSDDGRLVNNGGSAKNVDIQLLEADLATPVQIGNTAQRDGAYTTIQSGAAVLTYAAQYYATAQSTAGDVKTSVNYVLDYK